MIRFGMIGTSSITDQFIRSASRIEGVSLSAIYSRSRDKATDFAAKHSIPHIFTDLDEMAQSNNIDAVYIASPNSLHASQSILFLQNRKHVLCEKPIASNLAELTEMIHTAKTHNTLLMEAMKSTFLPNFMAIKENIHKVGKIRRFTTSYCKYSSRYDAYKEGRNPNTFNPQFSNGSLMDLGVYCIYPVLVLFGKPKCIHANGVFLESGVDGQGSIVFEYDGMDAVILHSKIANSWAPTEIQGENGTMVIDKINIPEQVRIIYKDQKTEDVTRPQSNLDMMYEIQEFVNRIQNNTYESEINSYSLSLQVMEVLDTARNQIGLVFPADLRNHS